MTTSEIYFSCDVEADGPIPGEYSMLSFGAAAFSKKGELIATFTENLFPLPGAKQHPDTMAWWQQAKQRAAWDACHQDQKDPEAVMKSFAFWVTGISEPRMAKPVFVGYPVSFDWLFLYWYLMKFAGRSPFEPSYSGLDLESYAMRALGLPYTEIKSDKFPQEWKPQKNERPHVALSDAIEQGELFINMLRSGR
jgi:hypothetical protein